jgi:tetratricopeptide (TPR) repeat protein
VTVASKQVWTREEVRRMIPVTERQLRSWEQQGLLPPRDEYAFGELIALRTLGQLRELKISPKRIKSSFESLRERLSDVRNPLTELKIFTDGKRIGVQIAGQRMDSVSGQLLLDFDRAALKKMLAFPKRSEDAEVARAAQIRKQEADHWFQKGLDLEQSHAPVEQAIEAYENASRLNPQAAGALVNLGTIYFHQRDWKKSEKYYKQAIEADAGYALAHFNLGNLYDERGKRAEAFFHYHAALRIHPNYADAHYNLALLHQGGNDIMKAVSHWTTYLKLDPSSQWANIARRELTKLKQATLISGARERA